MVSWLFLSTPLGGEHGGLMGFTNLIKISKQILEHLIPKPLFILFFQGFIYVFIKRREGQRGEGERSQADSR